MQPKDCLRCGCTDMMISVCAGAACAVGARDSRDEAGGEAAPRIAPLDSRRTGGGNAAWWLRRARDHCPPATDSLSVAGGHRRRLPTPAGCDPGPEAGSLGACCGGGTDFDCGHFGGANGLRWVRELHVAFVAAVPH